MLVFTRRTGESFHIGNGVKVIVLSIKGSKVRIGISAAKDVHIRREELCQRIKLKR